MLQNDVLDKSMPTMPFLKDIMALKPAFWENDRKQTDGIHLPVSREDIKDAGERWLRFTPFIEKMFPETKESKGIIESPLRHVPDMKARLEHHYGSQMAGDLYVKCDHELPIAGSIKARGGIYEVLKHAETLALENGMITQEESYEKFASPEFKRFFNQYSIGVGSTGNLGLSIGIISAALGFEVTVHMSADAKQWKKDLLAEKGAKVVEYEADFSEAITEGRQLCAASPKSYFVDDEDSRDLFLGYSIAASYLQDQLERKGITVDKEHPLFVYLPCGVGGSPGGITFGLKQIFGDHVHCFFVEPTHSPSVLMGLATGKHEKISVQDFDIDNVTEADGLAVGRPSSFATEISDKLVSGIYTVEDDELFKNLALLYDSEALKVEPSAASGLTGPIRLEEQSGYIEHQALTSQMDQATHIVWSTGGSMVPDEDWAGFYQKGKTMLD
ncbi:D-serine ammonia-lyase [Natribacillus halophilus]|uniref:Probable D-serine dehydratase n=1 Tax=Natribacillus halophilus TaxID=549003 RepID=A0A1G8LXB3_9BACI|nr:D-serine ammonia-lyase [Natribacillus halophilus]SDI60286.1 D-serine ammonia-lyase [Natribacillus halophilus]